ncbi:hypothetical protein HJG53_14600 [Sphingomonas sp. ID1715]|uniref:hypothetical protein n=1 Tax=Sphingomonas sp. ID1715 TaxID=1656898 RepID=UPI001488D63D|nr:hypothetical protein [Sphingomonas sp. ID1715]NNM78130.1 hypothetical protein [Sphingomonas sp. ID1715]
MKSDDPRQGREAVILLALALSGLGYLLVALGEWGLARWPGLLLILPFARRATYALQPPKVPWPALPLAHLPIAMLCAAAGLAVTLAMHKLLALPPAALLPEVRRGLVFYSLAVVALMIGRHPQA